MLSEVILNPLLFKKASMKNDMYIPIPVLSLIFNNWSLYLFFHFEMILITLSTQSASVNHHLFTHHLAEAVVGSGPGDHPVEDDTLPDRPTRRGRVERAIGTAQFYRGGHSCRRPVELTIHVYLLLERTLTWIFKEGNKEKIDNPLKVSADRFSSYYLDEHGD